jgi:hypothetical protein
VAKERQGIAQPVMGVPRFEPIRMMQVKTLQRLMGSPKQMPQCRASNEQVTMLM